jgi:hypothetical protein
MKEENFKDPIVENLISAYAGFTPSLDYHRTASPKPFLAYFPGLLPRQLNYILLTAIHMPLDNLETSGLRIPLPKKALLRHDIWRSTADWTRI